MDVESIHVALWLQLHMILIAAGLYILSKYIYMQIDFFYSMGNEYFYNYLHADI